MMEPLRIDPLNMPSKILISSSNIVNSTNNNEEFDPQKMGMLSNKHRNIIQKLGLVSC
jgi:hypothetical protein